MFSYLCTILLLCLIVRTYFPNVGLLMVSILLFCSSCKLDSPILELDMVWKVTLGTLVTQDIFSELTSRRLGVNKTSTSR